jgi:hypothetical protein
MILKFLPIEKMKTFGVADSSLLLLLLLLLLHTYAAI